MLSTRFVLHLKVPYFTKWGQNVYIAGAGALLGNWSHEKGLRMACRHHQDQLIWEVKVELPLVATVSYKYAVLDEDGNIVASDTKARTVVVPDGLESQDVVEVNDEWEDTSNPSHLLSTSAFSDVILAQRTKAPHGEVIRLEPALAEVIVRLRVWDYGLREDEDIVVTGSLAQFGNWQQSHPLALTEVERPYWETEVRAPLSGFPITYKYAVRDSKGNFILEHGENRIVSLPSGAERTPALIIKDEGSFRHHMPWQGGGAAAPVFSLRTKNSLGVGEFLDIKQLVDFCEAVGMRLIQLLPINDTSVHKMWWDSYPYNSLSVFALHPIYLNVDALSDHLPDNIKEEIALEKDRLNLKDLDYEDTLNTKLKIAKDVFNLLGDETLESPDFEEFLEENKEWLQHYALFTYLRDFFGTAEHWQWGTLSKPTDAMLKRLLAPDSDHYRSIQFVYYLQYHLHAQLLHVSQYAASKRVALKGDLPIGVNKSSVDTWVALSLFRMNFSTGAPPDFFDSNGQNWGFPTYNWEEMAKDNYAWWRKRLTHMSKYFHAYRIDHILGFFRIWEIPGDCVAGIMGHFRPSLPIHRSELEQHGVWDLDRLCEPHVTWSLLQEQFGGLAAEVASKYFSEAGPSGYKFRPQYCSEAALDEIRPREGSPQWLVDDIDRTRTGLMNLRHNVVLLRSDEDPNHFYPRFRLQDTASYAALEPHWQRRLAWLHDDYFFRRQEELWRGCALERIPALQRATRMLVCGEDLGMVPDCVHPVMQQLGLLGLRIQRMAADPGAEFGDPAAYPYMVVASPSCHDTTTTRAWWEEDAERRERFYYKGLGGSGPVPEECTAAIARTIVRQHMESPAMWAIFPIQDIMALSPTYYTRPATEETINNPTVRRHYWRYRMHVTLEDLLADQDLLADLQSLLIASGRTAAEDLPVMLTQDS